MSGQESLLEGRFTRYTGIHPADRFEMKKLVSSGGFFTF